MLLSFVLIFNEKSILLIELTESNNEIKNFY